MFLDLGVLARQLLLLTLGAFKFVNLGVGSDVNSRVLLDPDG